MNVEQTLEWCMNNGINFKITKEAGLFCISASNLNVSAGYPIGDPVTPEAIGDALFSTLYSLEFGSKFHQQHGFMPSLEATKGTNGAGGSPNPENSLHEGFMSPRLPGSKFET